MTNVKGTILTNDAFCSEFQNFWEAYNYRKSYPPGQISFIFPQRTLGHTYEAYKHHFKLDSLKLLITENVFLFTTQNLSYVSSMENLLASAQAEMEEWEQQEGKPDVLYKLDLKCIIFKIQKPQSI